MAGVLWTPEEDETLIRLHGEGKSLHFIAKAMTRGTSTIHTHAKALGLSWDRSKMVEANMARVVDAAALRTALELELLEDAARLRKQLFAPVTAYSFGGRDNVFNSKKLAQPSAKDQLDIMRATTLAVQHSLKISEHDVDAGTGAAIGMLDKISDEIKLAALDLDLVIGDI